MRHLLIKNLGPIDKADIQLGQVNVLIGMQSSGKSCILKIACYCTWVEKRLELSQKKNVFCDGSTFIDIMSEYYQMKGYVYNNTYIEYETNRLFFSYNHSEEKFTMKWKSGRWNYKRPKVSYIPADRNLVAAIPGWSSLSLDENMLEFMSNWDKARKFVKREDNFLNLGISYSFDSKTNTDNIHIDNGSPLKLKESSSGIQSLLPMYVHLDYLTDGQYKEDSGKTSYEQKEERKSLLSKIYANLYKKKLMHDRTEDVVTIEGVDYSFSEKVYAERFKKIYHKYFYVDHSEIFLEEPEDNLFPPTQCQLVNWILEKTDAHNDMLFVATHSPYVLNQFIKMNPKELSVMYTHPVVPNSRRFSVRQLNTEEIHEFYDNGVDMFFNFEMYETENF